jgi:hypothetical protein
MRSALVSLLDYTVANIIIANPYTDLSPEGYLIIQIPEDSEITFGWIYNPDTGTFTNA